MRATLTSQFFRTVFVLFLCIGVFACSDDDDNGDPTPSAKGVEGSWNITALTVTPAIDGITDVLAYLVALSGNDCILRTTFIFKSDGTIDGTVPSGCTTDDDIVDEESTWKVVGDKIQLTDSDGDMEEYDLTVNDTEMKWSFDEVDSGVTYKYSLVFKRK